MLRFRAGKFGAVLKLALGTPKLCIRRPGFSHQLPCFDLASHLCTLLGSLSPYGRTKLSSDLLFSPGPVLIVVGVWGVNKNR